MKLANAMATALNIPVQRPAETQIDALSECDLIGFGSGIYYGNLDNSLFELIDKLPKDSKKAFIFSTRGRNKFFEKTFHKKLRSKLTEKGYTVIGEFSCRGFAEHYKIFKIFGGVNKGHPTNQEIENAKTFALNLTKK